MFFLTFFLPVFFSMACALLLTRRLLLAGNRLARTLPGARVGVGSLAADRQATPVPQPAVATDVHQQLDVL